MDHQQGLGMTTHSRSDQAQGNDARNMDIERQFPRDGGRDHSVNERKTPKTIFDPKGEFLQNWNVIFLLSGVISVLLDPLFFYLPVINEDKKCIGLDKKLWITAIVFRSVTDIIYLMHIIFHFRTGFKDKEREKLGKGLNTDAWKIAKRYLWPYFLIDILAILPIPQVVILTIFSEMGSTKASNKVQLLNSFVLFQYVQRVYQTYLFCKRRTRNYRKFERTILLLVKVLLNFMLYILAGHALGAFWYFFSTQRLATCWHIACENHSECVGSSFNCDHNFKNISFIDDICPINIANTTSFNFGIFLEALQSGVLESTDFRRKLFFSFWWGMRNLSALGQNLQTSDYIWENCFAFSISICGLILFLYFMMGSLQTYMEWRTTKEEEQSRDLFENWDDEGVNWEEIRMRRKRRKRQKQLLNLKLWMSEHGFDRTTSDKIMDYIYKSYEADEDVYVETLIPDLPTELRRAVNRHICLNLLKSLKIIKDTGLARHEQLLLKICYSLKPMFYNEHCYIVREGEPIDAVFFITDGIGWTYTSNNGEGSDSRHAERLGKGQYVGGELLEWFSRPIAIDMYNLSKLPISSKTLKTETKVEVFALMAHDLKQIWHSKLSRLGPEESESNAALLVQRIWRRNHPKMDDSDSVGGGSRKL